MSQTRMATTDFQMQRIPLKLAWNAAFYTPALFEQYDVDLSFEKNGIRIHGGFC